VTLIRLDLHNSSPRPLAHPEHEFLYVVQGVYSVRIDGVKSTARAGDLVYLPAGWEHAPDCRRDGSVRLFLLWFQDHRFGRRPWVAHDVNGRLLMLFHWLRDHTPPADDRDRFLHRCLTAAFFREVEDLRAGGLADRDPVRQAMEFLRHNLTLPTLDLGEVCSVVGLGRSALTRRFTKAVGVAPMAWLQALRVRTAHDLLAASRTPVSEVARTVGFRSAAHLSRLLRRELGRSPRDLRRHGPGR
jgi:AraC-like DNA-binding protein